MLAYNEITVRKVIVFDDQPYEVLTSHVMKKNRQKPSNQTKLRNLISGAVVEKAFHASDKVDLAEIDAKDIKYLYSNKGERWFCDLDNPKNRFTLSDDTLGNSAQYLKENTPIEARLFNDEIIGISIPSKIELKVVEAPPSIKGNTSSGGTKNVVTETGAIVATPLFIEIGDIIRVNTETGNYSERVEKA